MPLRILTVTGRPLALPDGLRDDRGEEVALPRQRGAAALRVTLGTGQPN